MHAKGSIYSLVLRTRLIFINICNIINFICFKEHLFYYWIRENKHFSVLRMITIKTLHEWIPMFNVLLHTFTQNILQKIVINLFSWTMSIKIQRCSHFSFVRIKRFILIELLHPINRFLHFLERMWRNVVKIIYT